MSGETCITFTQQDLAEFSEASGDRNPLHLSEEYARKTPYGQPVVFGCLGAMACLGLIRLPARLCATSLEAEFLRPMFAGVNYRVETSEQGGRWGARLFDGSTLALLVTVTADVFQGNETAGETEPAAAFERSDPTVRQQKEMIRGFEISGAYNNASLTSLAGRWGVTDRLLARALCWSSYLVGMQLPGESALFFRLALSFHRTALRATPMCYRASVVYAGYGQIKMDVALRAGDFTLAAGQCWSYVRPPLPEIEEIDSEGVKTATLAGRTAVLTGSSRGLGAAIGRALDLRGATVYGIARSANGDDPSRTEAGDAADAAALRRLRERVSSEHSRLDFLICNACPPPQPLLLEPNAAGRIGEYINLAVSLTLAPLSEFLEVLNRSDGCVVIVSSAFAEHPVKEWPQYVAAKRAVEALGCVASLQYPRVRTLIVRPPKLVTAMTNTPAGRLGAVLPGLIAERIAARLENPPEPGKTEILD
jgi:NAD(P)-dependent dehydrogenase (short-subunit alcohol dehydrogenase family)/acyl dehydratase